MSDSSKMKENCLSVVRISTINQDARIHLISHYPEIISLPYSDQMAIYNKSGYTYSNAFSKAMNSLGYNAHEIVYDFQEMQKTWAREHNIPWNEEWRKDIILAQISSLKPDIILFQDHDPVFPKETRTKWKEKFPFIQLLLLHKGSRSPASEVGEYDVVFSAYPEIHEDYLKAGISSHLLYHGFDHYRLPQLQKKTEQYECTFSGSSGFGICEHRLRYWTLNELFNVTCLQGWIQENESFIPSNPEPFFIRCHDFIQRKAYKVREYGLIYTGSWAVKYLSKKISEQKLHHDDLSYSDKIKEPDSPLSKHYPMKIHPPVHGINMLNLLHNSKISLQIGGDAQIFKQNGSMRQFEITGTGSLLLMDHGDNINDLFIPDKEIMTFSSTAECIENIQYLLENEDERIKIAQNGQKRTLKNHTTLCRCKEMDRTIQELI